jgi:hypothetical protein
MKGNAYVPFMLRRGDGSTLSLDFTAMGDTLDSRFTFTRSSTTSTYINSSGLVATAGTNVPRFDYDPTTLTSRGLLIEGSAINIATYSNDFSNAIWTLDTSGGTLPAVSTVSQTGPDGASTVTRITFNKTGGVFSRIRQTLSGTASQPYTMSVWMKANTANGGASTQNVGLRIGADSAGFNCSVTTTWKRFQYTYTLSGTDAAAQIMLWDNIIGNDETADVLVYGCQIELGSGASSYIPTGASTVQRTADTCIAASTGFSSWFTGGTTGTFYADWFGGVRSITSTVRTVLSTSDVTGRHLHLQQTAAAGNLKVADFGAANSVTTSNSITSGARTKGAFSFSGNTVNLTLNGGTVATSSSIAFSTAPTYLVLGGTSTNGSTITDATVLLNGSIRAIKYWPSVLPTATLQSLTT